MSDRTPIHVKNYRNPSAAHRPRHGGLPILSCTGCSACCSQMGSPPFVPDFLPGYSDLERLPPEVLADYRRGLSDRAAAGWPDGVRCFWLTESGECRHYEHRPDICQEFVLGGTACVAHREG